LRSGAKRFFLLEAGFLGGKHGDFQNLPGNMESRWPTTGYGIPGGDDFSGYLSERADILNFIRKEKITGLVTVAGDRHSFLAGLLSPSLPPKSFEPVAAEFVTGSISAPGLAEAMEYNVLKDHPFCGQFIFTSLLLRQRRNRLPTFP
jgi:alkaline phosphatase D